jgi:putative FmdB family regulatory protein
MPTYDYKCNKCGMSQEIQREFGENHEPTCCQETMSRVWSATPIFRGGGWGGS